MKKHYSLFLLVIFISARTFIASAQNETQLNVGKLKSILAEPKIDEGQLASRDAQAKRQSQAAIELLKSGHSEAIWSLLKQNADPGLRSYLIRDIGNSGVSPDVIIKKLKSEKEVSIRRALILTLGEFTSKQLSSEKRKSLVTYLLQLYSTDPDPGIHSAIDWLLRYNKQGLENRKMDWQSEDAVYQLDRSFTSKQFKERNWYLTTQLQTMAIIDGPIKFTMGAPLNEPGREKGDDEAQHQEEIPRSFAIATKEVTVEQFQTFLDANPEIKRLAQAAGKKDPTRDGEMVKSKHINDSCPQILMTWFEAAQYCNWLSQQEGIPKEQWCYPTLDEIKEGMTLPKDCLHRTGYRMPTEAEWEFASRAGSLTSRFFGEAEELLKEYAWYTGSTFNERPYPVGQLKPNDFGLFDVYGNVWEWGQDWVKHYKSDPKDSSWIDDEDTVSIVSKEYKRSRKGGSYTYNADFLRSAYRNDGYIPDERRDNVGFRLARTMHSK